MSQVPFYLNVYVKSWMTWYEVYNLITELQVKIQEEEKYYGSVEANEYGFWSPVCNVDWDDHDANVTCRQMNFYGGVAFRGK